VPLYFFDIAGSGGTSPDPSGIDLLDDSEARDQAIALLPDIARNELPDGDQHKFVATARNERGEVVYEASLALHGTWWPSSRELRGAKTS
jgi:hypothetical protein